MIRGLLCLPNDSKNKVRDYHVEQRARWHSMALHGMVWHGMGEGQSRDKRIHHVLSSPNPNPVQ